MKKGGGSGGTGSKTLPGGGTPTHGDGMTKPGAPFDLSDAIGCAIVKYNYQAQQMDELSLTKGEGGGTVACSKRKLIGAEDAR